MRWAAALLLGAGVAGAEVPPPEYFTGVYERVGRDGAVPPGLLNDLVRLDPVDGGLLMRVCGAGPSESLLVLRFDEVGDVSNLLTGREGPFQLWCLYGNDGDNYPLLTCTSDGGARFLMWPEPGRDCAP